VRKRRNANRGLAVRAVRAAGSVGSLLWAKAARRPVDSFAIFAAVAASAIIVVNAVFLQSGSLPAPFFAAPAPLPSLVAPLAPTLPLRSQQRVAARPNDPIAVLIGQTSRIMAVQRVLTDYGYGQITPSGVLDQPTMAAIGKFERERGLPVTGQVSDRLVNELAAMTGRPLE
jgi:hypothetical protein